MTMLAAFPIWQARGPRFLLLLFLFWVLLRVAALTAGPGAQVMLRDSPLVARQLETPGTVALVHPVTSASNSSGFEPVAKALRHAKSGGLDLRVASEPALVAAAGLNARLLTTGAVPQANGQAVWSGPDRHRWRFAMFDKWLEAQRSPARAAFMTTKPHYPPGQVVPLPPPVWPQTANQRWSLSLYSYWRGNASGLAQPLGNRPQALGGSQSAARLDYALGKSGTARLFLRLTATPVKPVQSDAAIGASFRPMKSIPVDLIVEQRFAVTGDGSDATLVYAAGGVDDVPIAGGFALSAYGQGGLVRATKTRAFADTAVAIEHPLAGHRGLRWSAGAMVAGAAQPGAARLDIGPRTTVRLSEVAQGARLSLDWRARVAGDAPPASGLALTLSTGF